MKVVINVCYGGFGLSRHALDLYCAEKGIEPGEWHKMGFYTKLHDRDIERNDPTLIQIIEHLGKEANGRCAELKIVDIPDDIEWSIHEYDGMEWVAEAHRTWS